MTLGESFHAKLHSHCLLVASKGCKEVISSRFTPHLILLALLNKSERGSFLPLSEQQDERIATSPSRAPKLTALRLRAGF